MTLDMSDGACGWLVIDKPLGMTSRAVVDRAMGWFPKRTALGHTGTLDPRATGVLVLAVGRATRLTEFVQDLSKTYTSTFRLGATSATDDGEGPIVDSDGAADPGRERVEDALRGFLGVTEQTPPAFSAARVAGRRAYAVARAGTPVLPNAKSVRIDRIDVVRYQFPLLDVEVTCGKGTYIRSLARDLGAVLGIGGYVSELRRTQVGPFTVADASSLDDVAPKLLPLERGLAGLPRLTIIDPDVKRFRLGQTIDGPQPSPHDRVACYDRDGRLVAIARPLPNGRLQPDKVLWQWTE